MSINNYRDHGATCALPAHADLERQANDFAVEVERLRKVNAYLGVMRDANMRAFASAEQRAQEVAGEMRATAKNVRQTTYSIDQRTHADWLEKRASRLSPEPPAAKMRHWTRPSAVPNDPCYHYAADPPNDGKAWMELRPVEKERDDA